MNLGNSGVKILDQIKQSTKEISSDVKENKGVFTVESVIAERKSFLSKKKLVYIAKFTIDETNRELIFSEMLKETGFGISSDSGDDIEAGVGFKKYSYKTDLKGQREETIEEQSNLFKKKYNYSFELGKFRKSVEKIATDAGYRFIYKVKI